MLDAQTQSWIDQDDADLVATIRCYGWAIQYVFACGLAGDDGEGPPFAYTVGLFGLAHPELVVLGLPPETATSLLNHLGDEVRAGKNLVPGVARRVPEWPYRIIPEVVPNGGEIALAANRFYFRPRRHSVPLLQVSYPDEAGQFPGEPGHVDLGRQPRPGSYRA